MSREFQYPTSVECIRISQAQSAVADLERWLEAHGYSDECHLAFKARLQLGEVENRVRFRFKHADQGTPQESETK